MINLYTAKTFLGAGTLPGVTVVVFHNSTNTEVDSKWFEKWEDAQSFKDCVNSGELDFIYEYDRFNAESSADSDAIHYGSVI
jgi:hypothetical protein